MGRKRVISSEKKIQTSVSLKTSIVELIDMQTSRRSAWIAHAIDLKIKEMSTIDDQTLRDLLNRCLQYRHINKMSFEERAVIERLFNKLPESGE